MLDTNFLIDVVRFKVDLDILHDLVGSYELVTFNSVKNEITRISRRKSRDGMHARVALEMIERFPVHIQDIDENPDKAVLKLSGDFAIATNDRELRRRLKEAGKKTIYLKSKKHLAIG